METLGHFLFTISKSAFQCFVYAFLIEYTLKHVMLISIKRIKPFGVLFISSFVYLFSYWGDHGLGDEYKLPIGFGDRIVRINGYSQVQEFRNDVGQNIYVSRFVVLDGRLYGELDNEVPVCVYKNKFIEIDLKSETITEFDDLAELIKNDGGIPEMKSFDYWYNEFYGGWRFWLLP